MLTFLNKLWEKGLFFPSEFGKKLMNQVNFVATLISLWYYYQQNERPHCSVGERETTSNPAISLFFFFCCLMLCQLLAIGPKVKTLSTNVFTLLFCFSISSGLGPPLVAGLFSGPLAWTLGLRHLLLFWTNQKTLQVQTKQCRCQTEEKKLYRKEKFPPTCSGFFFNSWQPEVLEWKSAKANTSDKNRLWLDRLDVSEQRQKWTLFKERRTMDKMVARQRWGGTRPLIVIQALEHYTHWDYTRSDLVLSVETG